MSSSISPDIEQWLLMDEKVNSKQTINHWKITRKVEIPIFGIASVQTLDWQFIMLISNISYLLCSGSQKVEITGLETGTLRLHPRH